MNRALLIFMVLSTVAILAGDDAALEAGKIKEFGSEKLKPIDSGFFFWNFKYVEAPYVVERKGLDIYVNGYLVRHGPKWPPFEFENIDPGDPPPDSSPLDDIPEGKDPRDNYWTKKYVYIIRNNDQETARKLVFEMYQRCGAYSNVEWSGNGRHIVATTKDGEKINFRYEHHVPEAPKKDEVLAAIRRRLLHYETLLNQNSLISASRGLEHVVTRDRAIKALDILSSDSPASQKLEQMKDAGVFDEADVDLHKIVTEFVHNEGLTKRLRKLKQADIITPESVPVEKAEFAQTVTKELPSPESTFISWKVFWSGVLVATAVLILVRIRMVEKS